ncbi:MAG: GNAT family N-acetyltransferase [Flavobacteriaceae bacterium]|nr:GNAT family N-acetyltransferase [Flavobacteriaceae bacterium]|tara:strand:+ start:175 stop:648 length:474 start_codon:yes stop_codon:yes gene_type:complete
MEIKRLTAVETYHVRHPVLRPGRPIEDCFFMLDDHPSSLHLGLELGDSIVSVISALPIQCCIFPKYKAMRLRGIATLDQFQKQGYGSKLIQFIENELKEQKIELLWLNARVESSLFYSKLGYEPIGAFFNIDRIGMHQMFYKLIMHQTSEKITKNKA